LVSDEIKVNIELELIKQAEDALPSETERDRTLAEVWASAVPLPEPGLYPGGCSLPGHRRKAACSGTSP